MPAFKNSLHGALSPTIGGSFFLAGSSPAASDGLASMAICASILVGHDPGDCPTPSNFFFSSILFISPGVGGALLLYGPLWVSGPASGPVTGFGSAFLPPTLGCDLSLCHAGVEKQPIRSLGGCFGGCAPFSFTGKVTEVLEIDLQMADEWSHISHILEREEEEFQAAMRAEVDTTSLCTINSNKIEFLKYFTDADIIA